MIEFASQLTDHQPSKVLMQDTDGSLERELDALIERYGIPGAMDILASRRFEKAWNKQGPPVGAAVPCQKSIV